MRIRHHAMVLMMTAVVGGPALPAAVWAAPAGAPAGTSAAAAPPTATAAARVAPGQRMAPAVSGAPAVAAVPRCRATYACFWVHTDFRGARGQVRGNNRDFRAFRTRACPSGTWNDCISSIMNSGTRCTIFFYRDIDYRGGGHSLARGDRVGNFGAPPPHGYGDPAFNDSISSNRWRCRR